MSWITIEREALLPRFLDWGMDIGRYEPILTAPRYCLPPVSWITGALTEAWLKWSREIFSGFEEYDEMCVDYVQEFCVFAQRQLRITPKRPIVEGHVPRLAAVQWFFKPDLSPKLIGHNIAMIVTCPDEIPMPCFYDAWPARVRDLSEEECASTTFAYS